MPEALLFQKLLTIVSGEYKKAPPPVRIGLSKINKRLTIGHEATKNCNKPVYSSIINLFI